MSVVTLQGEGGWEERTRLGSLSANVALNAGAALGECAVSVEALRWGEGEQMARLGSIHGGFETILASDLLYATREYDALAATVHALAAPGGRVLLGYPVRHVRGARLRACPPCTHAHVHPSRARHAHCVCTQVRPHVQSL